MDNLRRNRVYYSVTSVALFTGLQVLALFAFHWLFSKQYGVRLPFHLQGLEAC